MDGVRIRPNRSLRSAFCQAFGGGRFRRRRTTKVAIPPAPTTAATPAYNKIGSDDGPAIGVNWIRVETGAPSTRISAEEGSSTYPGTAPTTNAYIPLGRRKVIEASEECLDVPVTTTHKEVSAARPRSPNTTPNATSGETIEILPSPLSNRRTVTRTYATRGPPPAPVVPTRCFAD